MSARRVTQWALVLSIASALAGCGGTSELRGGGASTAGEPNGGEPSGGEPSGGETAGGDNEARVTLRVQAPAGARFGTTTHVVTETSGVRVLTESLGSMHVESVDPEAHTLGVFSTVSSIRQTDAEGRPLHVDVSHFDLTGVSFRRTIDRRGTVVGRVEATGMTETNAAIAETIRSTIEQSFIKLPEEPVGAGDSWADRVPLSVPVEGNVLPMLCTMRYRVLGTEGTGDALAARLELDGECEVPETTIGGGIGSIEIASHTSGSWVVSVRDGMTGTIATTSDTTTTVRIRGESAPRTTTMRQSSTTVTTPLVD
jgi:hypothetical protein